MTVTTNTGPLIALAKINQLNLLENLFLVRPLLEEARKHGYWLSDELITVASELAGENE